MSRHHTTVPLFTTIFWIDLGLVLLSLFLFILTLDYPQMASTFPRLVLIMVLIVTFFDMFETMRSQLKERSVEKAFGQPMEIGPRRQLKVFYAAFLMFVFFFLLLLFGVIFGTFLFILLSGRTLGYRKFKVLIGSAIIITVSVYIIFRVIMKSFLPEGLLFAIIGG